MPWSLRSLILVKTTKTQPSAPPTQAAGKIGLWGAPTSGKTTFLAALSIAAARKRDQRVQLFGADDPSTDFLIEQTALLTRHMKFPPATNAESHLNWVMHMNVDSHVRRFGQRREPGRVAFELNFLDAPGRNFDPEHASAPAGDARLFGDEDDQASASGSAGDAETFLTDLASCDGLVLLFDPTNEWQNNDVFHYFHGTLLKIAQRRLRDPNRTMDQLPQYVAVCTTKFDHYDVYRKAHQQGFVYPCVEDRFFPKVRDKRAEEFFLAIGKESPLSNADLVRDTLRTFFAEDRVQFFVSSAIGFRVGPDGIFDERDFGNVEEHPGTPPRIRGPIYPVNVIEPLLWLGQKLAGGQ
jgi:hypothetical protein